MPAASSADTASELSTAGAIPPPTAALIAVVDDTSSNGGAESVLSSARSRARRVPEPGSLVTNGVDASSRAVIERPTHSWPGATTTTSSSCAMSQCSSPLGTSGLSTKPMSARPARTAAETSAELPDDSDGVTDGS